MQFGEHATWPSDAYAAARHAAAESADTSDVSCLFCHASFRYDSSALRPRRLVAAPLLSSAGCRHVLRTAMYVCPRFRI